MNTVLRGSQHVGTLVASYHQTAGPGPIHRPITSVCPLYLPPNSWSRSHSPSHYLCVSTLFTTKQLVQVPFTVPLPLCVHSIYHQTAGPGPIHRPITSVCPLYLPPNSWSRSHSRPITSVCPLYLPPNSWSRSHSRPITSVCPPYLPPNSWSRSHSPSHYLCVSTLFTTKQLVQVPFTVPLPLCVHSIYHQTAGPGPIHRPITSVCPLYLPPNSWSRSHSQSHYLCVSTLFTTKQLVQVPFTSHYLCVSTLFTTKQLVQVPFTVPLPLCVHPIYHQTAGPGPIHSPITSVCPPYLPPNSWSRSHSPSHYLCVSTLFTTKQLVQVPFTVPLPLCVHSIYHQTAGPGPIHRPITSVCPPYLPPNSWSRSHSPSHYLCVSTLFTTKQLVQVPFTVPLPLCVHSIYHQTAGPGPIHRPITSVCPPYLPPNSWSRSHSPSHYLCVSTLFTTKQLVQVPFTVPLPLCVHPIYHQTAGPGPIHRPITSVCPLYLPPNSWSRSHSQSHYLCVSTLFTTKQLVQVPFTSHYLCVSTLFTTKQLVQVPFTVPLPLCVHSIYHQTAGPGPIQVPLPLCPLYLPPNSWSRSHSPSHYLCVSTLFTTKQLVQVPFTVPLPLCVHSIYHQTAGPGPIHRPITSVCPLYLPPNSWSRSHSPSHYLCVSTLFTTKQLVQVPFTVPLPLCVHSIYHQTAGPGPIHRPITSVCPLYLPPNSWSRSHSPSHYLCVSTLFTTKQLVQVPFTVPLPLCVHSIYHQTAGPGPIHRPITSVCPLYLPPNSWSRSHSPSHYLCVSTLFTTKQLVQVPFTSHYLCVSTLFTTKQLVQVPFTVPLPLCVHSIYHQTAGPGPIHRPITSVCPLYLPPNSWSRSHSRPITSVCPPYLPPNSWSRSHSPSHYLCVSTLFTTKQLVQVPFTVPLPLCVHPIYHQTAGPGPIHRPITSVCPLYLPPNSWSRSHSGPITSVCPLYLPPNSWSRSHSPSHYLCVSTLFTTKQLVQVPFRSHYLCVSTLFTTKQLVQVPFTVPLPLCVHSIYHQTAGPGPIHRPITSVCPLYLPPNSWSRSHSPSHYLCVSTLFTTKQLVQVPFTVPLPLCVHSIYHQTAGPGPIHRPITSVCPPYLPPNSWSRSHSPSHYLCVSTLFTTKQLVQVPFRSHYLCVSTLFTTKQLVQVPFTVPLPLCVHSIYHQTAGPGPIQVPLPLCVHSIYHQTAGPGPIHRPITSVCPLYLPPNSWSRSHSPSHYLCVSTLFTTKQLVQVPFTSHYLCVSTLFTTKQLVQVPFTVPLPLCVHSIYHQTAGPGPIHRPITSVCPPYLPPNSWSRSHSPSHYLCVSTLFTTKQLVQVPFTVPLPLCVHPIYHQTAGPGPIHRPITSVCPLYLPPNSWSRSHSPSHYLCVSTLFTTKQLVQVPFTVPLPLCVHSIYHQTAGPGPIHRPITSVCPPYLPPNSWSRSHSPSHYLCVSTLFTTKQLVQVPFTVPLPLCVHSIYHQTAGPGPIHRPITSVCPPYLPPNSWSRSHSPSHYLCVSTLFTTKQLVQVPFTVPLPLCVHPIYHQTAGPGPIHRPITSVCPLYLPPNSWSRSHSPSHYLCVSTLFTTKQLVQVPFTVPLPLCVHSIYHQTAGPGPIHRPITSVCPLYLPPNSWSRSHSPSHYLCVSTLFTKCSLLIVVQCSTGH